MEWPFELSCRMTVRCRLCSQAITPVERDRRVRRSEGYAFDIEVSALRRHRSLPAAAGILFGAFAGERPKAVRCFEVLNKLDASRRAGRSTASALRAYTYSGG